MPNAGAHIVDDHIWIFSKKELLAAMKDAGFTVKRLDFSKAQNGARHFNLIAVAN